jgi:hypothetical protein
LGLVASGNYLGQQLPPDLKKQSFCLAAAVGKFQTDQTGADGQVAQALNNIEEPDVLGALKRTLGTAETIPERWGSQELLAHAIHNLSQDAAWTEIGLNGTDRTGGGADTAGKAALQVLAAGFGGQLVFKLMIKILNAKFFHKNSFQLSAISDQQRYLKSSHWIS